MKKFLMAAAAAGALLVSEAGGIIANFSGEADYLYKGNVIAAEGESFVETDVAIESMDYLVEGVIGSTS